MTNKLAKRATNGEHKLHDAVENTASHEICLIRELGDQLRQRNLGAKEVYDYKQRQKKPSSKRAHVCI